MATPMKAISQSDFDYVRDLVRRYSAIVLEADKDYLIETRLATLVRRAGLASLQELMTCLRTHSVAGLDRQVVEAIATHETSFFRDLHPFETLGSTILPELIARRPPGQSVTIWCAACSSGQEPFSVAMLAREQFPELVAERRLRIIATDLSAAILARAREGWYNQIEVSRGLPAGLRAKYFDHQGTYWRIRSEIRGMVEFQQHNLAAPWPSFPPLDLIFMRNVLIYFGLDTRKAILARVREVLRPDGYLFLGSSETTLHLDAAFEPVATGKALYYKPRSPDVWQVSARLREPPRAGNDDIIDNAP